SHLACAGRRKSGNRGGSTAPPPQGAARQGVSTARRGAFSRPAGTQHAGKSLIYRATPSEPPRTPAYALFFDHALHRRDRREFRTDGPVGRPLSLPHRTG